MKAYTKLTIAVYIFEIFIIAMVVGGFYYFLNPILKDAPEYFSHAIGMFAIGIITHKYLSTKWKENKSKIFNIKLKERE